MKFKTQAGALGIVVVALVTCGLAFHLMHDADHLVAGPAVTPTPTLQLHTVQLSKEDAATDQLLVGWDLIAYRGPECQGHPVNNVLTQDHPVSLELAAGQYSFLESMQAGWTNVTPLCQPIDLTAGDGALVFQNRRIAAPGDADCSDEVDSIDAALILQLEARLLASLPCQQEADVDENGTVDSQDASLVLQHEAGLIDL